MLNIMLSWRYYALFMLYRLMTSASDIVLCWKYVVEDPNTRGGTQQMFIRGVSVARSNPLPFYIPFFTKKVLLSYIFF